MPQLEAGGQFGPYHLIRLLGQGGSAQVWEALSRDTGRRLALKVLTQLRAESPRALERFQLEGRLAASISHPRCVYVYAAEEIDGLPVISMELMPGGTLGARLAEGPLLPAQAVDYVLDVLDGLEVAQRAGIIHRDIKPTNCFLDGTGGVKVGDFGISKSLEIDSSLSVTGSFLGTPYYASPEQVSGEPLDFRSDLYSVGAMLYELLGGRPPFAGGNPGQVIAQVLTKPPPAFAEHGVMVPRGLQRVVFRLLAKQKEKRYPSYQAARQALISFSSRGLSPAQLARRFGAIAIDFAVLVLLELGLGLSDAERGSNKQAEIGFLLGQVAYYSLTEGYLGGSIGKLLVGLRVANAAGDRVTLSQALSRTAVFVLFTNASDLVARGLLLSGVNVQTPSWSVAGFVVDLMGIGLLLSTMRRANGYSGVHELVSGTRVVVVRRAVPLARVSAVAFATEPPESEPWSCPPFRVVGTLWRRETEALFLARDDDLNRNVWIHRFVHLSSAPPLERLHLHRAGSLPWLQRSETSGFHWDAYGAPQGTGLTRWVADRGRLTWKELRGVLLSLGAELEARLSSTGTAGRLSLAHVWVNVTGDALLLDFSAEPPEGGGAGAAEKVTSDNWHDFMRRVVVFALEGKHANVAPPRAPMPEHARGIMTTLFANPSAFASPGEFRAALERDGGRPTEVTVTRRLGSLVPSTVIVGFMLAGTLIAMMEPTWSYDLSKAPTYMGEAARIERESQGTQPDSASLRTMRSVGIVLSAAYAEAQRAPKGAVRLGSLPESTRAALASAAEQYPAPNATEVTEARRWLAERVDTSQGNSALRRAGRKLGRLLGFGLFGAAGVVLALLFRGSPILHLFGITVQRNDGLPAGRWHCGLRALVAWSPFIVTAALKGQGLKGPIILIVMALGGVVWSVLRPERGPADRLVGTVLMPK